MTAPQQFNAQQLNAAARPIVSVRDLSIGYGSREIVHHISFDVHAGEFIGLLGANGVGKTTLFRTLMGLIRPTSGSLEFAVEPVNAAGLIEKRHRHHNARRHVGYVPQRQDVSWDFPINVLDFVMLGRVRHIGWFRRPRVHDFQSALTALQRVGMADFHQRTIGELSGGQRQRVLVARALAGNPQLLLLDEPFNALDMPTQEMLTALFQELVSQGESIIMSSHDVIGSQQACSRIILFNGRILGDAQPHSLTAEQWAQTFQLPQESALLAALLSASQSAHAAHAASSAIHATSTSTASASAALTSTSDIPASAAPTLPTASIPSEVSHAVAR